MATIMYKGPAHEILQAPEVPFSLFSSPSQSFLPPLGLIVDPPTTRTVTDLTLI